MAISLRNRIILLRQKRIPYLIQRYQQKQKILKSRQKLSLSQRKAHSNSIEDVSADVVDRQFIAIQSKNGNTFYIVIDKDSKGKENVYFMNLVDEYDMMAFADDFPEGVTIKTPHDEQVEPVTDAEGNVIETPDNTSEGEKDDKTEKNEGESGGNNTLLILVGVLALAGGGAFYYFKVYKTKPKVPKQSLYDEDEEEYEEETVNEDTVDEETSDDDEKLSSQA